MTDAPVPVVDCYRDGDCLHVSNGQQANGRVFSIRPRLRRTSSLCTNASFDRSELESHPLSRVKAGSQLDWATVCPTCHLHVEDLPEEAFTPPTDPLELSDAHVRRAKNIIARLEDELGETLYDAYETRDSGLTPLDFVDEWAEPPQKFRQNRQADELETRAVSVDAIVGSRHPDRFIPQRLERVLYKMLHGGWETAHLNPPKLAEVDGTFYVHENGNHRTLAYKSLGIDRMHAAVGLP